jgi:hypothetical protein
MRETTLSLPIEKVLSACRAIRNGAYDKARTYADKNEFSSISKSEAFVAIFDALMPESVQALETLCEAISAAGQTTIQVSAEDFVKIRLHYDR